MERYKRGKSYDPHSLDKVFSAYGASRETEFVKSFFDDNEIDAILNICGLPSAQFGADKSLEEKVYVGTAAKRADLIVKDEDTIYYFEVMSQLNGGKWDNDHHEQFLLKTMKLALSYGEDNVHSFAVAFKEFDAPYLEDIQRMENGYAVHLRFDDTGWYPDVYGIEEKEKKKREVNDSIEERGKKWLDLTASKLNFKNRKDTVERNRYLYIGKAFKGVRMGIELALNSRENEMGIKLNGNLVAEPGLSKIVDDTDAVVKAMQEKVPDFKFIKYTHGSTDRTVMFEFDSTNYSDENMQLLKDICIAFAEECNVAELLES